MRFGLYPRFSFYACLLLGMSLILIAVWLKRQQRRRRLARPRNEGQVREKSVVLLGRGEKIIESGIAGVFVSLDKFLRDITAFQVEATADLRRFEGILRKGAPVILGIDCSLGAQGAPKDRRGLRRACFEMRAAVVFFYNAARPDSLKPRPACPKPPTWAKPSPASGTSLEIISYAISLEDNAPRPAAAVREGSTLEGKNIGHALPEILQFLEARGAAPAF